MPHQRRHVGRQVVDVLQDPGHVRFYIIKAVEDALETLEGEMGVILAALATVREVMSCGNVHALYKEAKTAVCCDWAYAANFLWVSRVATAVVTLPAAVAAIAGYKRFHKTLWGPYASVQSQEVGAYL